MDCNDFEMNTDDSDNDELRVGSLSYEKMTRRLQKVSKKQIKLAKFK